MYTINESWSHSREEGGRCPLTDFYRGASAPAAPPLPTPLHLVRSYMPTCLDTLGVELGDGLVGLPVDPSTCKKTERLPVEKMGCSLPARVTAVVRGDRCMAVRPQTVLHLTTRAHHTCCYAAAHACAWHAHACGGIRMRYACAVRLALWGGARSTKTAVCLSSPVPRRSTHRGEERLVYCSTFLILSSEFELVSQIVVFRFSYVIYGKDHMTFLGR